MTATLIPNLKLNTWTWQGHQIPYTVMGSGKPLLLIHGFGASIGHWRKNIPVLADRGYKVFAMDLLGFGGAAKPAENYSLELWQKQIKDFWEAQIQEPTVFIGNSIGGLLTLMVMSDYPEITRGGVLINCAGGLNFRPNELNLPLRLMMGVFTKLVSSPITGKLMFNNIRNKKRIRKTLYQVYQNREAVTEELVDIVYQPSCDPGAQQVFASVLTAPPGPTPKELLPKLQHPLFVLWGEEDPWTPITVTGIYQELPNAEFHPIPNAGHCPHDEKPKVVNELIVNWLSQV